MCRFLSVVTDGGAAGESSNGQPRKVDRNIGGTTEEVALIACKNTCKQ